MQKEKNLKATASPKLNIPVRPRRLRRTRTIRQLVQEHTLRAESLIYPLFICEGENSEQPIRSLPGQSRWSIDRALFKIEEACRLGIGAFAFFPVVSADKKDEGGTEAFREEGLLPQAVRAIKERFPQATLISDVALDPYTDHGHDGIISGEQILNDETVDALCKQALVQARAGVDFVAPSDMMDGRVGAIRQALDAENFTDVGIISYAAKYASAFYGPFREALGSAPRFSDKKTYQMDAANRREAIREALLDEDEGADILMVKPALPYLDIIADLRAVSKLPISAYHVSGEYAMLHAAAERGMIDFEKALLESLLSIHRAGADMIWTYGALEAAKLLKASAPS